MSGAVDTTVLRLLTARRDTVRLVATTNATMRLDADLARPGITHLFDAIVNSSAVAHIKPEAEFFRIALDISGVEAGEALFVDDTLANVEAARALGIRSHHFTNPSSLERFMSAEGVLVRR